MADKLPYRMRFELERATRDETLAWAGWSSGVIERIQGGLLIAAGFAAMAINYKSPIDALALVMSYVRAGEVASAEAAFLTLFTFSVFLTGAVVTLLGWLRIRASERVLWAVTDRRLLRLVARAPKAKRSFMPAEIKRVERLNWDDAEEHQRGLAVTVRVPGTKERILHIFGPDDLDIAERAIANLKLPAAA